MPTTTRGSLPPGVYWRRRLAVLSVALLLVLGFAKLLGSGGGGDEADTAAQAGAPASPTATVTVGSTQSAAAGKGRKGRKNRSETPAVEPTPTPTTPPPLADPTGPCADDDVFMTPSVDSAIAGTDVTFLLNFQTATSEACTFDLSADAVRIKISRGHDTVWQSRQCPDAVPTQEIVVRRTALTQVPMTWRSAKRSDEECSDRTAWVLPNVYTISSSVLGGEPTVVDFDLTLPAPPTLTQTVTPTPTDAPASVSAPAAG